MARTLSRPRTHGYRSRLGLRPAEAIDETLAQDKAEREGNRAEFMEWSLRVPEPKGRLDFDLFPFQRELYEEGADDREAVVMKSTQVGVSAWGLRWALYHTDTRGATGLYVFPTKTDMWDFSALRVAPLISGSRYLSQRQLPDDPDSKGLKKIGLGHIVFRGSESKRGLDSVDADHIVFDEYDTLEHDNIPDAERRISGPLSKGLIRRVGVPSIPDWGIGQLYDRSDRRRWFVKCGSCNEWQDLDFFQNVDQSRAIRVCAKCAKPLDVTKGEWVAEFPERDVRGYHATRLIAPTASMEAIIKNSKKRAAYERQVFFNKDLGLPYAPEEGRLSKKALAAAQREFAMVEAYVGSNLVTMGVDVADVRSLNVRISEHIAEDQKRGLWIGEVDSFDALDSLMTRFGIHMCGIDHMPNRRLAMSFAERHPGRVYLIAFNTTKDPKDPEILKVKEELHFASVRRVEAIDATFEMIRAQRNLLPIDTPDEYAEQMQALVRVSEEDPFGKKVVTYRRTGAADDYAHAEIYDLVATELWWRRQGLDEAQREVYSRLEDHMEFERSSLADYDKDESYDPGPRDEDDYYPGGGEGPGDF